MRGYGNPQITWAVESLMDELAEELGLENLVLVNPDDILEQRSKGLEAAEVVGELRRRRLEKLSGS